MAWDLCLNELSAVVALPWVLLSSNSECPRQEAVRLDCYHPSPSPIFPHRMPPVPPPWRHTFHEVKALLATAHMVVWHSSEDMCMSLLQLNPPRALPTTPNGHMRLGAGLALIAV